MKIIKPSFEILTKIDGDEILRELESYGRTCYRSEDKITPESSGKFVFRIINSGHLSVIEHFSISVRFICDRGVSHELVRHRLASFSQESTRYCNYKSKGITYILPPWIDVPEKKEYKFLDSTHMRASISGWRWYKVMLECEKAYLSLLNEGQTPEQARSVLPSSLKTEIVMTCNIREWKHVLNLRCAKNAHPQMREIMIPLRDELQKQIPIVFN